MSQGSRFIAAAAAALVVSVGAAGLLTVRSRGHNPEAVPFSPVASDAAAASPASPLTPPVIESPVAQSPAPKNAPESATAASAKIRTPKPAVTRPAPQRESRPARPAQPAPSLPEPEPRVEASQVPPPVITPAIDPPPAPSAAPPPSAPVEAPPVETQKPRFEELTVKADSVVGLKLEQSLSSATAKIEERVTASVSRDVTVDGRTVLPIGTKLEGTVTLVEPGSKFKGRARLGIRFHTIVLADGQKVPIQTQALLRNGESATGTTAATVGTGAAAGAILGAVMGGKRGAIIGAGVGAGGGAAAVAAGTPKEVVLPSGTLLTVRLTDPVTITIERDPSSR